MICFISVVIIIFLLDFSVKGLPLPPGMPSPLKTFLTNGGLITAAPAVPQNPTVQAPVPSAPQGQVKVAPTSSPNPPPQVAKMSVSDAFNKVEPVVQLASSKTFSSADLEEVSEGVLNLADTTKKLIVTQNNALEVSYYLLLSKNCILPQKVIIYLYIF